MNISTIAPVKLVGFTIIVDAVWSLISKELPHKEYMDVGRLIRLLCGIYIMTI